MTRTESARLVGHNYRHLGVTFGKPWERIDRCGPGEYVGRHREPVTWLTTDCARCDAERRAQLPWPQALCVRMILCPECGDKRCPKAAWHGNACNNKVAR